MFRAKKEWGDGMRGLALTTAQYSLLKVWRGCTLRVFAIGDNDSTKNEEIRKGLQKYIYMLRIDAELFVSALFNGYK
ncbi:hypothetical protein ANCDUO_17016 [Ancylostoma duodenale]|uniref:Uncharacterized protein n=1 Tax=Ancylostoma duodenale TaxID=51022 RepID=A0A0C2G1U7_9BILA|nr:hypothetical protein ANCDUO_17016 [Ancylostoma duodenale]